MLVKDPVTGLMVDDGTGEQSLDVGGLPVQPPPGQGGIPVMPGALPMTNAVDSGGSPPPGIAAPGVTVQFPAQPEHQSTATTERKVQTDAGKRADLGVMTATGAQLNAEDALTDVGKQEGAAQAAAAAEKARLMEAERLKQEEIDKRVEAAKVAGREANDKEVAEVLTAKRAAGSAREDAFQGGSAIIAAILRGIDRAASSFLGQSGPTGVDRILDAKVNDFEKKKISDWEASEAAHKARAQGREAYQAALAAEKLNISQSLIKDLSIVDARKDAALAQLTPARREAEGGKAKAAIEAKIAEQTQKREDARDIVTRFAETNRTPTAKPADAALGYKKEQDNLGRTVNDPITGKPIGLANTEQLAKEMAKNGEIIAKVNTDIARIREINKILPSAIKNPIDAAKSYADPKMQALRQEADNLKEGILPQMTQMNGAGAPSEGERAGLKSGLSRGLLQSPESFDKAMSGAMKGVINKWRSALPSAGVVQQDASQSRANPDAAKVPQAKAAPAPSADRSEYLKTIAEAAKAGRKDLVIELTKEMNALK